MEFKLLLFIQRRQSGSYIQSSFWVNFITCRFWSFVIFCCLLKCAVSGVLRIILTLVCCRSDHPTRASMAKRTLNCTIDWLIGGQCLAEPWSSTVYFCIHSVPPLKFTCSLPSDILYTLNIPTLPLPCAMTTTDRPDAVVKRQLF